MDKKPVDEKKISLSSGDLTEGHRQEEVLRNLAKKEELFGIEARMEG